MAKGKPNCDWKKQILEWRQSNKSAKAWCKENKVPYTTFIGWKKRFKKADEVPEKFIELKDLPMQDPGISLEYYGVKIHLKAGFDQSALKKCLSCLRGTIC